MSSRPNRKSTEQPAEQAEPIVQQDAPEAQPPMRKPVINPTPAADVMPAIEEARKRAAERAEAAKKAADDRKAAADAARKAREEEKEANRELRKLEKAAKPSTSTAKTDEERLAEHRQKAQDSAQLASSHVIAARNTLDGILAMVMDTNKKGEDITGQNTLEIMLRATKVAHAMESTCRHAQRAAEMAAQAASATTPAEANSARNRAQGAELAARGAMERAARRAAGDDSGSDTE